MKAVNHLFFIYTQFLKKVTTVLGTFFIYFIAIFIGKLIYTFTSSEKLDRWQNFQTGSSSSKMY
jgi:hypothetical protein